MAVVPRRSERSPSHPRLHGCRAEPIATVIVLVLALLQACEHPDSSRSPVASRLGSAAATVAHAMRATVLVEREEPTRSVGSGIVLRIRDGVAWIATARHLVDPDFPRPPQPGVDRAAIRLTVAAIDDARTGASVEWLAPHGIDLAILTAPLPGDDVREAYCERDVMPRAGDEVFAIGNPQGERWALSTGTVSQVREQQREGYEFRVLQSTLALRPGDSGGGLFDDGGRLVGINGQSAPRGADPRLAGGLALSTSLTTLLDLAPASTGLCDSHPGREPGAGPSGEPTARTP